MQNRSNLSEVPRIVSIESIIHNEGSIRYVTVHRTKSDHKIKGYYPELDKDSLSKIPKDRL